MSSEESFKNCFTYIWKLENISYCLQKKGERIESPALFVGSTEKAKFKLGLCPRGENDGNYIGCFLFRAPDRVGADQVDIKYDLAFLSKEGTVLSSVNPKHDSFTFGTGFGYAAFHSREDVFISRRSAYLPEDTLTVCCRIWKTAGNITEDVQCITLTRIGVEKLSFVWTVENFSTLEPEKKYTYEIKSVEKDTPVMSVDVFLTGGMNSEEIICFELSLQDQTIKFSSLRLSLLDGSGNKIECNHNEFWFGRVADTKEFTFSFTKKKLLAKKSVYLPDDNLSLLWEWVFSKGVVSNEIKDVSYGPSSSEKKISIGQQMNNEKIVHISNTLNDNLKPLFDSNCFCDIKLKTDTNIFSAHKVILSAYSSVFKAKFLSGMKKKHNDSVDIEDLSDDAVGKMLLYVYTARVEELTWKSASDLYVAADKYAILCLKNICSSYLKENLSPSNACEALLLADLHSDCDLKPVVQDYILKHVADIINSDEWKVLMDTKGKLAAETLCLGYK